MAGPGFLLHRLRKPVGDGAPQPQPFGDAVEIVARLQFALKGELFTVAPRALRLTCRRDGRAVAYGLGGDPVEVIAVGDVASDALAVIEALRDLGPFGVYDAARDRWIAPETLSADPTIKVNVTPKAAPPAPKTKAKKKKKRASSR